MLLTSLLEILNFIYLTKSDVELEPNICESEVVSSESSESEPETGIFIDLLWNLYIVHIMFWTLSIDYKLKELI